ncbi:MAG TPA: pseudoazurin [Gammaproteobacteria bacterium]|nr:pseudoazurin [Gammaproteobacteria bacterium]
MKKLISAIVFATAALGAGTALAEDHVVKEMNSGPEGTFVFSPSYIQIHAGDTVTFTPTDEGHNSESAFTPEGAAGWKSEISKPLTVTFTKPGVYIYECTPHKMFGMVGVIVVDSATDAADARKAAANIEKQQIMNQGRLTTIMKKIP